MPHLIPDDGWPHSRSTECGCQPQLTQVDGRYVLAHPDMTDQPAAG